jgi:quinoprotein glucose dehydrogenase
MPARAHILATSVAACLVVAGTVPRAQPPVASYTEEQAAAGRVPFNSICAACHGNNLRGNLEAPELAGPDFRSKWTGKPVAELFAFMREAMPPVGRKPSDVGFANIIAYILSRNGIPAGTAALDVTSSALIVLEPGSGG